ncbi:hypothetical protein ACHAXT_011697 [Thalassiosira profunda]
MALQPQIQAALQCLHSPSSPAAIQQAQDALMRWEETQTDQYVVALVSLMGAAPSTLRLAAVLALKAAVVRRWKDKGRGKVGAPKILLTEGVKQLVRQALLQLVLAGRADGHSNQISFVTNLHELTSQQIELIQDRPLQTNAASLLSKIARMDLPLKFHQLIPTLVEGVKGAQTLKRQQQQNQLELQHQRICNTIFYNTMNALEAVLSEMSTQRLLVDKKYRNAVATQHLGSLIESGLIPALQEIDSLRSAPNGMEEEHKAALQYATVTSRVVSHLMCSSFSKLAEEATTAPRVDQVLTLIHSFLSQWLDARYATNDNLWTSTKELLSVNCNLIVNLQQSHPLAFLRYLKPFLELFYASLMRTLGVGNERGVASGNPQSGQFTIAFVTFLANVVGGAKYADTDAAKEVLQSFFTPRVIQTLAPTALQLFSMHLLPGNDEDDDALQWQDDPEGFYHWELARDDVGCAAQNLFLALVESPFTKDTVLPWFVGMLTNVASQRLAVEIESGASAGTVSSALPLGGEGLSRGENVAMDIILQWDAIYTAAGLAGSLLEGHPEAFNFQSWYHSSLGESLGSLLQSNPQPLPILRRRIIWLLSCNAHHEVVSYATNNPLGMLTSALSAENDICVRLTAVQALEALLPQCEEYPMLLNSIVQPVVPALYQLTNECSEVESRSSCLDLMSNLVTYVGATGGSIPSYTLNAIVAPLSKIWDNATEQNLLLKRNVLTILSCIAAFVGPESCAVLYPTALPMIDEGFSRQENVFLVEEALRLWWTFLRLSRAYDPLMGKLFIRAAELSKDLDNLMVLMRITEHYISLGQAAFLNEHAATLQTVLGNTVGKVRPRGTAYVWLVVEALLRSFPVEGGSLLQSCGVLKEITTACACRYYKDANAEPDRVIVLYLTALARTLLATPSAMESLLPVALPSGNTFGAEELISLYLDKYAVAGNGAHGLLFQKLWALLLLSFYPPSPLPTCYNAVLGKSNEIFGRTVYLLENINADGSNLLSYEVGYDEEEETVDIGSDAYESLLQELRAKDVACTTPLSEAVAAKLNGLPNALGQSYQEFLGTIDNDTLRKLEEATR